MTDPRTGPSQPSPPAGAPPRKGPQTPDAFLQTLLRSKLLDRTRLDAALAGAPDPVRASARQLADYLIEAGHLTHYQAEKLLQGLSQGLVLGPYHVLAPLGRGGMGTVYLAERKRESEPEPGSTPPPLSDLVALKVLPPKRAREEERTLARFRREMDLGMQLAHPNVTRTFEAGEVGGIHYIVMEYVPGQSLRQVVVKGGPLSVPDAARVFADVAAGLAHAHGRGMIHRDLKPSNIMVTPDGRAKILDLGLALMVGEDLPDDPSIVGGQGYVLGTMDYIAPEQTADSTAVGPASDLYALGCSIYYAVTGMPPFPGGTSQQKIRWHRTEAPPPVSQFNPAIPAGFRTIIEHLMAKKPEDRPMSAMWVRERLLAWAAPVVSRAAGGPNPHTASEAVADVDRRTLDPGLWDAALVPTAAAATAAEPANVVITAELVNSPSLPQPPPGYIEPAAREKHGYGPSARYAAILGAAAAAAAFLGALFGLLWRK